LAIIKLCSVLLQAFGEKVAAQAPNALDIPARDIRFGVAKHRIPVCGNLKRIVLRPGAADQNGAVRLQRARMGR
jgi:hypothetical protein